MGESPLISVVMPNLNGAKYLERAIATFLQQDHERKELVIVDGKSTDGSHELIRGLRDAHAEIEWIERPDRGISDAINMGIEATHGEIVGYMGSDDLLEDGLFERIASHAARLDFDAIYFDSYTWYVPQHRIVLRRCPDLEMTRRNLVEYGTIVGLQNIYFRRHVFERHHFNPENRFSMDYEFYLAISDEPYLYLYVDTPASINIFDGNVTGTLGSSEQALEAAAVARRYCHPGERTFADLPLVRRIRGRASAVARTIMRARERPQ